MHFSLTDEPKAIFPILWAPSHHRMSTGTNSVTFEMKEEPTEDEEVLDQSYQSDTGDEYIPPIVLDLRRRRKALGALEENPMPAISQSRAKEFVDLSNSHQGLTPDQEALALDTLMEMVNACHSQKNSSLFKQSVAVKKSEKCILPKNQNSESFTCRICGKAFTNRLNRNKHTRHVHKLVSCQICPFQTNSKTELKEHTQQKHESHLRPFKCSLCSFTAKSARHLKEHAVLIHTVQKNKKTVDPAKPYECQLCPGAIYSSKRPFLSHFQLKHGFSFDQTSMKSHQVAKTLQVTRVEKEKISQQTGSSDHQFDPDKRNSVDDCNPGDNHEKGTSNVKSRKRTENIKKILQKRPVQKFSCKICNFERRNKLLFISHLKETHRVGIPTCNNETEGGIQFDKSCKKSHDDRNSLSCTLCKKALTLIDGLREHERKVHGLDLPMPDVIMESAGQDFKDKLLCLLCGFSYLPTGNIAEKFGRPFLCALCFVTMSK